MAQAETVATRGQMFAAPLKAGLLAGVPARDLQGLENAGAKPGLGEDRHGVAWITTAIAFRKATQGLVGTKVCPRGTAQGKG